MAEHAFPNRLDVRRQFLDEITALPQIYTTIVPPGRRTAPINFNSADMANLDHCTSDQGDLCVELRGVIALDRHPTDIYGIVRVREAATRTGRLLLARFGLDSGTSARTLGILQPELGSAIICQKPDEHEVYACIAQPEVNGIQFSYSDADATRAMQIYALPVPGQSPEYIPSVPIEAWVPDPSTDSLMLSVVTTTN